MDKFPSIDERPVLAPVFIRLFNRLPSFPLSELEAYALLSRFDTKFMLTEPQTERIFEEIGPRYRILEVKGFRSGHYRTIYFDTPDLQMFKTHHNGRRPRYKVRQRSYIDSGVAFFEIKQKTSMNRTVKLRMQIPELVAVLEGPVASFVRDNTPYDPATLVPNMENDFLRVSLMGIDNVERLTIDFSVALALGDKWTRVPGLVVAELKQPKYSASSPFIQQVRKLHIPPMSFSKYCHAVALLKDDMRRNHFKERMLYLDRLLARGGSV